jgi:hypothetical protein
MKGNMCLIFYWFGAAAFFFMALKALVTGTIHKGEFVTWPDYEVLRADEPAQFWMGILIIVFFVIFGFFAGLLTYLKKN